MVSLITAKVSWQARNLDKVTLVESVDLLEGFKVQPKTLEMPQIPAGFFAKKLSELYRRGKQDGLGKVLIRRFIVI